MSARSDIDDTDDLTLSAAIERHQVGLFLVGTVAIGSLATALLAAIPADPTIVSLVALPISYIPAALAVLLLRLRRDAKQQGALRQRLNAWQVSLRWYVLAVVLVPGAHLAGVALATFWDGRFPLHLERFALLPLS